MKYWVGIKRNVPKARNALSHTKSIARQNFIRKLLNKESLV